jgi:hypothetical protein
VQLGWVLNYLEVKPGEEGEKLEEDEDQLPQRLIEFWKTEDVGMLLKVLVNSCVYLFV